MATAVLGAVGFVGLFMAFKLHGELRDAEMKRDSAEIKLARSEANRSIEYTNELRRAEQSRKERERLQGMLDAAPLQSAQIQEMVRTGRPHNTALTNDGKLGPVIEEIAEDEGDATDPPPRT